MRKDLKPVDLCYQHAQTISIANTIAARYDAGICRHKFEHPGVCEIINLGERVDMTGGRNKIFSKQASKQASKLRLLAVWIILLITHLKVLTEYMTLTASAPHYQLVAVAGISRKSWRYRRWNNV